MSEHAEDQHSHYFVPEQGWYPVFVALGAATMVVGLGRWLNAMSNGEDPSQIMFLTGFMILAVTLFFWFAKVVEENMAGLYNSSVNRSFVWGMGWFIFSEVMFFFAFFLALGYIRFFVTDWLGGEGSKGLTGEYLWPEHAASYQAAEDQWPVLHRPDGEAFASPHESMAPPSSVGGWLSYLPFWNTVILLSSSVTVHMAHSELLKDKRTPFIAWLAITVALGFIFVGLQALEYYEAYAHMGLTLASGIYGSTFFMLTGFHGFHVCLGAFILCVQLVRALRGHFSAHDCFGFEAGSWYWHFVDVVWVFLFTFVYIL